MESYRTVKAQAQDEFVERKSRFIGQIAPVSSPAQAEEFLAAVRKEHPQANHHCFAYALRDGFTRRFSDNGEPSGTAGMPILEVVLREELTDVMVVVTRYFGGILLGAGGLTRAYAKGAKLAVDSAQIAVMATCIVCMLEMDYGLYGLIGRILPEFHLTVEDTEFGAAVRIRLLIEKAGYPGFCSRMTDASNGQIIPYVLEERFDSISPM